MPLRQEKIQLRGKGNTMRDDWNWKLTTPVKAIRQARRSRREYEDLPWSPMTKRHRLRGSSNTGGGKAIEEVVGKIIRESSYKCGFCKGTGQRPLSSTCPVCKGKGEISINPPAVKCAFCKGKGEAQPRSTMTCLTCRGKGVVSIVEPIKVCPECQGSGHTSSGSDSPVCRACRGAGVITATREERKRFLRSPGGTARQVAEAIYQLGGEASVAEIAPRVRISSSYTEYVCKSMIDKGYLEKVARTIYALTLDCEKAMEQREISDLQKLSSEQGELLGTIGDNGESTLKKIAERIAGGDIKYVKRICDSLAKEDFVDVLLSGKVIITPKGEKALRD